MKINYNEIGSLLRSKETAELKRAIAEDMEQEDKPLSMLEFAQTKKYGPGIDWSDPELDEPQERTREAEEIDALDRWLEGES
jgi:hypothetical protein